MAKAQAVMEQSIPVFVKAAWKMSALEIQVTGRQTDTTHQAGGRG